MVTTMRVIGCLMLISVWSPIFEPNMNYYAWLICQIVSGFMTSIVALVCVWGDYFKSQMKEDTKTLSRVRIRRLGRGVQPTKKGFLPQKWLEAAE